MNIKSEPISPQRDSTTPSSQHQLHPAAAAAAAHAGGHISPMPGHISPMPGGHISPNPMANGASNSPSPITSTQDYDLPNAKRPRISSEGWAS